MFAYLDSSVLLRVIFSEKTSLKEFGKIEKAVSSELLRVECLRTIDRIRVGHRFSDQIYVQYVERLFEFLEAIELVPIQREILNRASQPFSTVLGTLDALHLSSAILYRERFFPELVFASHDKQLAAAALVAGFKLLE